MNKEPLEIKEGEQGDMWFVGRTTTSSGHTYFYTEFIAYNKQTAQEYIDHKNKKGIDEKSKNAN